MIEDDAATALLYAHQDWMLENEERLVAAIEFPLCQYYNSQPYPLRDNNTFPAIAPGEPGYDEAYTVLLRAAVTKNMQDKIAEYRAAQKEDARVQRLARKAKFAAPPAPSKRPLPTRGANANTNTNNNNKRARA
jgi:hypothetical protein